MNLNRGASKVIQIQSVKNQLWIAHQCFVAEAFFDRLRGLIGTHSLSEGQGLLLKPCNDIHMWFMSIPIDVVFVKRLGQASHQDQLWRNQGWIVSSVRKDLRPWKLFPVRDGKAEETLELPLGTIDRCDIRQGDTLCIS